MKDKIENLKIITFDDFDKLNLKEFADSLYNVMERGIQSNIGEKGSYTISLNAEFGNGKTTFLKMFKHHIESNSPYKTIFVNAWQSDFCNEPMLAILSEISNQIGEEKTKKKMASLIGFAANLSNQFIQSKAGIDLKSVLDESFDKEKSGNEFLKIYEQRKELIEKVKTALEEYIQNKKLLIIVDELDRTRPDYAIHFLEDMKHFFDIKDVVFLVAVNKSQMKETVKVIYGQEEYFDSYYRKFFKHEIDLPNPYKELERFVCNIIYKSFSEDKMGRNSIPTKDIIPLCKIFNCSLRDIEYFMRIFELLLKKTPSSIERSYMYERIFFIFLYLRENDLFKKVLNKDFVLDDYIKFVDTICPVRINPDLRQSFFSKIASSFLEIDLLHDSAEKLKKDKLLIQDTFIIVMNDVSHTIGHYSDSSILNRSESIAINICKSISQLKK